MNGQLYNKLIRFPYYVKYIGSALGVGAFIMQQIQLSDINRTYIFPDFVTDVDLNTPFVMFMLGCTLITFSKNKVENEETNDLRFRTLFISVVIHVAYFLLVSFVMIPGLLVLFNFPAIWLLNSLLFFYIVIFHGSILLECIKSKRIIKTEQP